MSERVPGGRAAAGLRHAAAEPARAKLLRRHNLALVLGAVASGDRPTRAQVAARTGLTKTTVSTLVDALAAHGLVVEGDPDRGVVGRPGLPLGLDPRGPAGLGVEVNVDYVSACVVDLTGDVVSERVERSDNARLEPRSVLAAAARVARRCSSGAERSGVAVAGVGVALPGLVDLDGVLRRVPNLPGWDGIEVLPALGALLGGIGPVSVSDNEANLAALAEHWYGEGPAHGSFVHVSGEIGVGAGIVVGGSLWRGARGVGGELGHVTVERDGGPCGCGARGCLEQVAGQDAILRAAGLPSRAATALGAPDGPLQELERRARAGEERTIAAIERAGSALGVALSGLVNVVDVPTVVLGGLYAALAPWLAPPVRAELDARVLTRSWAPTELRVSRLGAHAAVRGAAASVVQAILSDPAGAYPEMLDAG
ncbi:MAG: ROK family transcriptional regulator [Actinomycetota bacterium]|nr:ROK family transcriptional regulator [Actinomycetota bacterium]